jgi:hypothetical protein
MAGGCWRRMSVDIGGFLLDSGTLGDECLNGWRRAGGGSAGGMT